MRALEKWCVTSPDTVLVQPVEKLFYDENSSVRFNTIKRLDTELKWIKLLQSASLLGFNDNIYQEGNISKMPDFDVFSLLGSTGLSICPSVCLSVRPSVRYTCTQSRTARDRILKFGM